MRPSGFLVFVLARVFSRIRYIYLPGTGNMVKNEKSLLQMSSQLLNPTIYHRYYVLLTILIDDFYTHFD